MRKGVSPWIYISLLCILQSSLATGQDQGGSIPENPRIFLFEMDRQVDKGLWRITKDAFEASREWKADLVIIRMNTYGGLVDMADSIRTKILYYPKPVWVFIDNNAASAGSLISLACDSIFMRPGANIGAATVVNQTGEVVPDKFQSYMRSTMRSTAEAHGKDTLVSGKDTTYTWRRDPKIAEAMVDPSVYIAGLIDTGKVLTLTTQEAIKWNICEGEANSIEELLEKEGITRYELKRYKLTALERFISFLLSPAIQGILILLIIGGIYFELQSPGIGFPLLVAVIGALFYFAPLYLDGLAEHWEILLFIAGLALLLVEIFVIPGFGVAGISGIVLMVIGLSLSLIRNVKLDFSGVQASDIFQAFTLVILSVITAFVGSVWISSKMLTNSPLRFLSLQRTQQKSEGFVAVSQEMMDLAGCTGEAYSILRPAGKVMINGRIYDAVADVSWIPKGSKIIVVRQESSQVYVKISE
ncbi:MAG: serine protease [Bacteroidetes bacterium GWF2_49_14]|nr:MAG: serine protease [Bacteroidetes bacterium GWF2_49_14]